MLVLSIDQFITKFIGHLHNPVLTNLLDEWSQATKTTLQELANTTKCRKQELWEEHNRTTNNNSHALKCSHNAITEA